MNNHIDNFLDYYHELKSPQYAVLIKGEWGSGKTHYINEFKKQLEKKAKKYIYVSLYGVMNYDEIETKFLETLHPNLYNKKTILAGKIAKGFLKGALKIDLDNDGKADGTVNAQLPDISVADLLNTQNHILIFDDLERCSIPINDILGYINYFVEHQDYKVIIIANEEELDKNEKYRDIKEKLVGKTFELTSNSDLAFDSFIEELKKEENKDIFIENKNIILDTYKKSTYDNLRILRQTIFDFERFYEQILISYIEKKDLFRDLLKQFFIFSIENKYSNIDIWDLNTIHKEYMSVGMKNDFKDSDEIQNTKYKKITNKYNCDLISTMIFDITLWRDIIDKSLINKENIDLLILNSRYFINEHSPKWKQLWSFVELSDNDFPSILENVYMDLKKFKFNDIFEVRHVCAILINLVNYGLFKENKKNIIKFSKKHLDYLYSKDLIDGSAYKNKKFYTNERFGNNIGLGYYDENNDYSKDFISHLNKVIKKAFKNSIKNDFNDMSKLFNSEIEEVATKFDKYSNTLILNYFDLKELKKQIINADYHSLLNFGDLIHERYCKNYHREELISEKSLLKKLEIKLKKKVLKYDGTIKGYTISKFIEYSLTPSIKSLEKSEHVKKLREEAEVNQNNDR